MVNLGTISTPDKESIKFSEIGTAGTAVAINALTYFLGSGGTATAMGTSNPLPVSQYTLQAGEDLPNNVQGVQTKPVVSGNYSPSTYQNFGGSVTALLKATPGNLISFDIINLSGSIAFLQFHNVATVSPIGSVPVMSFPLFAGTTRLTMTSNYFGPSQYFSTGISAGIGTAAGTLGTTGLTASNFIWNVNYI